MKLMTRRDFTYWEVELSPDNFNLLSILTFRRNKNDFSFDKSIEHTAISTLALYVANTTMDKKWKESASILNKTLKVKFCNGDNLELGQHQESGFHVDAPI